MTVEFQREQFYSTLSTPVPGTTGSNMVGYCTVLGYGEESLYPGFPVGFYSTGRYTSTCTVAHTVLLLQDAILPITV